MNLAKTLQKTIPTIMLILLGTFGGYYLGVQGYEVKVKKEARDIEIINKDSQIPDSVDFSKFWEVWAMVNQKHIKRPLNPEDLLQGAIRGMVRSIEDPYTAYLVPVENKEALDSLNGKYEGIGAQLGYDDEDRLIIVAPLDGSPAERAGVRAGDKILEIEGEDTTGISVEEAVGKIRGNAGTVSTSTLYRTGREKPFEVKIVREEITVESVTWEDKGAGVAYIRLSRFGETTNADWNRVVSEIIQQMPRLTGIILDVRNNPGGYLESAVFIGSEFIDKGSIVTEDFSDGTSQKFDVDHAGRLIQTNKNDLKIVVLINGGSASASEIVAGALKEAANANLVGTRTFGKGSVQKTEEFADGSSLHVTVAKWLTPGGNWIDRHNAEFKDSVYNKLDQDGKEIIGGLEPDYVVEFTDEDIENQKDPQLNKALELFMLE